MGAIDKLAVTLAAEEAATLIERQVGTRIAGQVVEKTLVQEAGRIGADAIETAGKTANKGTFAANAVKLTQETETTANTVQKANTEAPGTVRKIAMKVFNPVSDFFNNAAKQSRRLGNGGDLVLRTGNSAKFARVQKLSGGNMVRVLHEDARPSLLNRLKDRLWYGGKVEYITEDATKAYNGSKVVRMTPKQVNGAVFHETPADAQMVRGKVNMTVENAKLYKKFDNKLFEATFLQKYAPGSIAKTEGMADMVKSLGLEMPAPNASEAEVKEFLNKVEEGLRAKYPKGYFLKGVSDYNTGGNMATDKANLAKLYDGYKTSYVPKRDALLAKDPNVDLKVHLRGHEFAAGQTVHDLLQNPSKVIVQERMPLSKWTTEKLARDVQPFNEYRLHVVDGHVVPGASTHRWSVAATLDQAPEMAEAEKWAEKQFQKMPAAVRHNLSFAPDVVRLEDGSFKFVELNVGGESGFLYKNPLAAASVSEAITGKVTTGRKLAKPVAYVAKGVAAVTTPIFNGLGRLFRVAG